MARRIKVNPPSTPDPVFTRQDVETMREMGLTVMTYLRKATAPDDEGHGLWIPDIVVGTDFAMLVHRELGDPKNGYAISGWEAHLGPHHSGGMYETMASALAWLRWARGGFQNGRVFVS